MIENKQSWRLRKHHMRECFFVFGLVAIIYGIGEIYNARIEAARLKCIENLRLIEIGKELWDLERNWPRNVHAQDRKWNEVVGTNRPLTNIPLCPRGGNYTLGNMFTKAKCSIPGHTLP